MTRILACFALLGIIGCASQPKPTQEQIASARKANMYTRDIDKSHTVADEASTRVDDPALH